MQRTWVLVFRIGIHLGVEAHSSLMASILLIHLTFLSSCPGFGPVFTTSDPDSFWQKLNEIHALGGGDEPEMCLSALEVLTLLPSPASPFPSYPALPGPATRGSQELARLPSLPPTPSPSSHPLSSVPSASFQGHAPLCSALPGSTLLPTILNMSLFFSWPASPVAHPSPL